MVGQSKKALVFWIGCIGFLLVGNGFSFSQELPTKKPGQSSTTEQHAPSYQRGTKDIPVVIEIAPSMPLKIETEHDERAELEKATNDRLTSRGTVAVAVFTLALACVTLGLAIFTYRLWSATNRLVTGADNTARHQLRAYVGIQQISFIAGNTLVEPHRAEFEIRNFGQTMAKPTEIYFNGAVVKGEMSKFDLGDKKFRSVIMPGETIGLTQTIDRLPNAETGPLYLWGRIVYKDVFGENRWTVFRFTSDSEVKHFDLHIGWKPKTCDEGNDAGDGAPPF